VVCTGRRGATPGAYTISQCPLLHAIGRASGIGAGKAFPLTRVPETSQGRPSGPTTGSTGIALKVPIHAVSSAKAMEAPPSTMAGGTRAPRTPIHNGGAGPSPRVSALRPAFVYETHALDLPRLHRPPWRVSQSIVIVYVCKRPARDGGNVNCNDICTMPAYQTPYRAIPIRNSDTDSRLWTSAHRTPWVHTRSVSI
jgi:hypothetical protein